MRSNRGRRVLIEVHSSNSGRWSGLCFFCAIFLCKLSNFSLAQEIEQDAQMNYEQAISTNNHAEKVRHLQAAIRLSPHFVTLVWH